MLYKYEKCNGGHAIDNIKQSALYFNTKSNFNDPFDIYPSFEMDEQERENALSLFKREKNIDMSVAKLFSTVDLSEIERIQDRSMPIADSKYGITCFSCERNNIVMWSHYADSHKGICIGFDINENSKIESFIDEAKIIADKDSHSQYNVPCSGRIFKICYQDTRPQFIIGQEKTNNNFLSVKYNQWAYENEYRMMLDSGVQYTFPRLIYYKPEILKELIFGANTSWGEFIHNYSCLKDHIMKYSIKTFLTFLDDKQYRLNIEEFSIDNYMNLKDNYCKFEDISLFEKRTAITNLKNKYGNRPLAKYWKEALFKYPLQYAVKLPPADVFKQYKAETYAPIEITKAYGFFINWMTEMITYLKEANIKPGKRKAYN